jgi:hypothetical protein
MPACRARLVLPAVFAMLTAMSASAAAAPGAALTTHAERSGFVETGRYDEVVALCTAFAEHHPDAVRCERFGTSPEGRPMLALVATRTGAFTPELARSRGIPVVLVQGGIHAGEIDGKDAGFLALREVLGGEAAPGALETQVLVFVPVFSVDGHERFGAWNRPNQRGPREMGWRTTTQNYNLNRDYMKADAPEMRALLGLLGRWDPIAYIDLHATNGAQFEHDISIQVQPFADGDADLRKAGLALRDGTIERLAARGSLPLSFYPSFVEHDNPDSGFQDGVAPPRFSTGYVSLRNRLGMLVETHSWKPYPQRVRATRNTVVAVLEQVAAHGRDWMALARAADTRAAALGGKPVALDYAAGDDCRTIEFRGYAWTRTHSEVSGAAMTRYDESTPQLWRVPLCDDIHPSLQVDAPRGGYLVPAAHAARVGDLLRVHGVAFRTLDEGLPAQEVEAFRAGKAQFAASSFEGRQRLTLEGAWKGEHHELPAGSLFVPVAQPLARLAIALLEPQAPDSMAAWGMFNNHFERKEYMEAYVTEQVARDMLAAEPALRAQFEQRLREDPGFAADPRARLDFFYRRHSAWDTRLDLYPVLRTVRAPR